MEKSFKSKHRILSPKGGTKERRQKRSDKKIIILIHARARIHEIFYIRFESTKSLPPPLPHPLPPLPRLELYLRREEVRTWKNYLRSVRPVKTKMAIIYLLWDSKEKKKKEKNNNEIRKDINEKDRWYASIIFSLDGNK